MDAVTPGVIASSGGVTISITGYGFVEGTTVRIVNAMHEHEAESVAIFSLHQAFAQFNLNNAKPGLWDLEVSIPGEDTFVLSEAIVVERPDPFPKLTVDLVGNSRVRVDRPSTFDVYVYKRRQHRPIYDTAFNRRHSFIGG